MAGLTISMTWPRLLRSNACESTARIVRSVGVNLATLDLALQDQDLMAKGEDLSVALVAGHQQQSEVSDQELMWAIAISLKLS